VYDDDFSAALNMRHMDVSVVSDLCRLCNVIRNTSQLVVPNTAQCLPPLSAISGNIAAALLQLFFCLQCLPHVDRVL